MALVGQLGNISLVELLGFFCSQRKTGRLKVDYPENPGTFYILDGELVDAKLGNLDGIKAVQRASRLPNAAFEFDPNILSTKRTIYEPWADIAAMDMESNISSEPYTVTDDLTATYTELLMENSVSDAELLLENLMSNGKPVVDSRTLEVKTDDARTIDIKPVEPQPEPKVISPIIKKVDPEIDSSSSKVVIPVVKPKPGISHPPLAKPIVEHPPLANAADALNSLNAKPINRTSTSERSVEKPVISNLPLQPVSSKIRTEDTKINAKINDGPAAEEKQSNITIDPSLTETVSFNVNESMENSSLSVGDSDSHLISDKSTGGPNMLRLGRNVGEDQNKNENALSKPATVNQSSQLAETPASLRLEQQMSQKTNTVPASTEGDAFTKKIKDGSLGFVGDVMNFAGEINFRSMLRVDGQFSGQISSQEGSLHVSAGAQVIDAEINVGEAVINGTVKGNVFANKRIELGRTAVVIGNIQAPSLAIHEGAVLDGCCRMAKTDGNNSK
jgi:cytoskeletal protein CcmA (bactofilin family)